METIKILFNNIFDFFDPERYSFLFFKYKPLHIIIIIAAVFFVYSFRVTDSVYSADTSKGFIHALLDNPVVYLPNYLTHEFAHSVVGNLAYMLLPVPESCNGDSGMCLAKWIGVAAGNGVETLVPLILFFLALRLKGGGLVTPPLLYWISTTIYGAARYASDARAKAMALTSSDFITNFKPGEANGDWYYILKPLGLLEYDVIIGKILFLLAAFCFVIAIFSAYYYFTHMEEITKRGIAGKDWNKEERKKQAETTFDNIYQGSQSGQTVKQEVSETDIEGKMPRL
ncbi:MAG: hypothetical protein LBI01_04395 [Elusimicrobium sp.]|jgi:hypothetical protein|nr:hypothetical protein [Elusimicrobium sp.]